MPYYQPYPYYGGMGQNGGYVPQTTTVISTNNTLSDPQYDALRALITNAQHRD